MFDHSPSALFFFFVIHILKHICVLMLPETIATICEQIVMSVFSAAAILQNDTYPVDPNLSEL